MRLSASTLARIRQSKLRSPSSRRFKRFSAVVTRVRSASAPVRSMPEPTRKFRFGAVILAAGASTRMGQPKQLLPLDGQPLIVRAVEAALQSSAWPVVVVLGANAAAIRPALAKLPVLVAESSAWAEGMAASIRAGVTTIQQFSRALQGVVVALCDQPAFSAAVIHQLVDTQR